MPVNRSAASSAADGLPQDFGALLRADPEVAGVLLGELHRQSPPTPRC
ncbi:hypothetical protein [Streptomyces sp. NPDC001665]